MGSLIFVFMQCIKFQVHSINQSVVSQAPKCVTRRRTDGQGQINMPPPHPPQKKKKKKNVGGIKNI